MNRNAHRNALRTLCLWFLAGFCGPGIAGCSPESPATARPAKNELHPRGWNAGELAAAVIEPGEVVEQAQILTWQIEREWQSGAPGRLEQAIVWFRLAGHGKRRWGLAHMIRYAGTPQANNKWKLGRVFDAPYTAQRRFEHPPGNAAVYEFLDDTWWKFKPEAGVERLDAGVCVDGWQKFIGENPTKFYQPPPEM